jgi:hypothetical protein
MADCGQRGEATEATEKALNSLNTDCSLQKNRLKGGRNANEALAQLSLSGCAVVFGVCVLSEHAQAQLSVPTGPIPAPPTQSPTLNPPNPGTVPQAPYTPITPSTPSITPSTPSIIPSVRSRVREEAPSTTARSERTLETRTVHRYRHHYRGYYAGGPTLGSFDCSYGWCVRISPPYAYHRPNGWYRY